MRKSNVAVLVLLLAAVWNQAEARDYTVDSVHSNVGFTVRHFVSKVSGEFKDFSGNFSFDEKDLKKAKVKFSVNAGSVNTRNEKRDGHLKSEDFFHVEKHPSWSFEGKKLTRAGKGKFKLMGDLTMRGMTKPVTFDVEYLGAAKDFEGQERVGFTALAKIKRKDFGINWNKALDNGGVVVGDDVEIIVQIEGIEKK